MPRIELLCLFVLVCLTIGDITPVMAATKIIHSATEVNDDKGTPLKTPEGVACTDQVLVVADTGNGRLLRYSYQGGVIKGGAEIKAAQLPYPIKVQIGAADSLYVLDGKLHRIGKLNGDGSFAGYLEPKGVPAPAVTPRSFDLDSNGNLYLLDILGERVVVLDQAGNFQKQIIFPPKTGFMSDITVDSRGAIIILDSINSRIFSTQANPAEFQAITPSLNEYMDFPVSITTDAQGRIYLIDQNGSAVITLGTDGSFQGRQLNYGLKNAFLNYPSQLCISRSGDLFIADRNNNRFQYFKVSR